MLLLCLVLVVMRGLMCVRETHQLWCHSRLVWVGQGIGVTFISISALVSFNETYFKRFINESCKATNSWWTFKKKC